LADGKTYACVASVDSKAAVKEGLDNSYPFPGTTPDTTQAYDAPSLSDSILAGHVAFTEFVASSEFPESIK